MQVNVVLRYIYPKPL